jgi:3',5'-nucleoside bisphosphate phosphatase
MIDLHLHSTASDGDFAPRDVVSKAWHAGLRTIAITDHDTVAGVAEAREAGSAIGVEVIAGIEITAVHAARDVHVLGYFVDPADGDLLAFLADQRADRVARVREMARRLGNLGLPIDADALLAPYAGTTDRSVGRPAVARALVAAGSRGRSSPQGTFRRLARHSTRSSDRVVPPSCRGAAPGQPTSCA